MASSSEKKKWIAKGKEMVPEGPPEWALTFADMITNVMAFFVLLISISTIDPVKLEQMGDTMEEAVGKDTKESKMSLADVKKEMDQTIDAEKLQGEMEIKTSPKGVTISISSDISFESGSAVAKEGLAPILQKIVPILQKSPFMVAVEGHTDSDPIPEEFQQLYSSNWSLSGARAAAVVEEFIRLGVDPARMQAVGYAEFVPRDRKTAELINPELIARLNTTPELKSRNRRVEISFLTVK